MVNRHCWYEPLEISWLEMSGLKVLSKSEVGYTLPISCGKKNTLVKYFRFVVIVITLESNISACCVLFRHPGNDKQNSRTLINKSLPKLSVSQNPRASNSNLETDP